MQIATICISAFAVLVSIFSVWFSAISTRKIRFFEIYFSEKERVYSEFWKAFSDAEMSNSNENISRLRHKAYELSLFSTKEIYLSAFNLAGDVIHNEFNPNGDKTAVLVSLMREDLEKCKKLKF